MRSIEAQAATTDKAVQKALDSLGLRREQVTVEVLREAEPGSFLGIGRKDAVVRVTERPQDAETEVHSGATPEMPVAEEIPQEEDTFFEEDAEVQAQDDASYAEDASFAADEAEDFIAEDTGFDSGADVDSDDDAEEGDSQWPSEEPDAYSETLSEDKVQAWNELLATEGKKPAALLARGFIDAVLQLMHLDGTLTVTVHEDKAEGTLLVDVDGDDCGILIGRRGATLSALQYMLILLLHRHAQESYFVQLDIGGYHRRRREGLEDLARQTAKRALETGNAYELNPMKAQDRRVIHETLAKMDGIITYSEGQGRNRFVVIDLEDYTD